MLWTPQQQFHPWPFDKEAELEAIIAETSGSLFGDRRIYLDVKKLIGARGRTQNVPDGYLLDLASPKRPVLYLVEIPHFRWASTTYVGPEGVHDGTHDN